MGVSARNLVVQRQPQPDADHVRWILLARGGDDTGRDAVRALHLADLLAVDDLDAVARRDLVHQPPTFGIEDRAQPVGAAHQPGDVDAAHVEALAQLVGDEAAAAGDGGLALQRARDQMLGVVERDEVVDVLQPLRARRLQRIRPAASGHKQRIVGQRAAMIEVDDLRRPYPRA